MDQWSQTHPKYKKVSEKKLEKLIEVNKNIFI